MSADQAAFIDTNVLVYAADASAPLHAASKALRDAGAAGSRPLRISTQVLLEYFAVITDARRVRAPRSIEEAWAEVANLGMALRIIAPPADHADRMIQLANVVKPKGAEVFDFAIAITALAAGISEIYTYDDSVFRRVPGLTVRTP